MDIANLVPVSYTHLDVYKRQGEYGLQATEPAWITSNQIEAARVAMTLSLIHI